MYKEFNAMYLSKKLLILLLFLQISCGRSSYWERTLDGPFLGIDYSGSFTDNPVSELQIDEGSRLLVYDKNDASAPVLTLNRTINGVQQRIWAKIMVPLKEGEQDSTRKVRKVELVDIERVEDSVKVKVSCDWTGGGIEGGIVYLSKDLSFSHFALSW